MNYILNRYFATEKLIAFSVGLLLFNIYFLSYHGGFHSVDEVSTYAVTESLVKFAKLNTNQIAWTQWATTQAEAQGFFGWDGSVYSKKGFAISLFQAPLYWLALHIPNLGMLQTVSILSAILTAGTAMLIVRFLQRLGYSHQTSIFVALIYGLATIAWVYAKYLFSSPLAGFLLMMTAYLLLAYKHERSTWRLGLAGFCGGLAVLTRANNLLLSGIFGIYLMVITFMDNPSRRRGGHVGTIIIFIIGAMLAGMILLWYNWQRSGNPLQTGYDLTLFTSNFLLGLYKLLFSPLRGLFIYSPILILSIWGWVRFRREHPLEAWLCFGLVSLNVLLFSFWSSGEGLSWGSRFMVPIIPFMVICLTPMLEHKSSILGASKLALTDKACFVTPILLFSFIIQILGVAINPWIFLSQLQQKFGGEFFLEKTNALYDFSTSQIVGQIKNWGVQNSDLIWWQPQAFDGLAFGISMMLVMLSGWLLYHVYKQTVQTTEVLKTSAVLALTIVTTFFLLIRYNQTDPQFGGHDYGYLQALNDIPEGELVITVAENDYHIPMNRLKNKTPLLGFSLNDEPLHPTAYPLLENAVHDKSRLWMVTVGKQPIEPTNRVEAWLAKNAFKATDTWFADEVRLVSYGVNSQSLESQFSEKIEFQEPSGNGIRLIMVSYPHQVKSNQILPVIFEWQISTSLQTNYTIFLQLLSSEGVLVVQHDGQPQGGYAPMQIWQPNEVIIDRHGLAIPETLPCDNYRLIAGLYNPANGERLTTFMGNDFVELGVVTINEMKSAHLRDEPSYLVRKAVHYIYH